MENNIQQFEEILQKNGIAVREKFLKNADGIYAGKVANSDGEFFHAKILETKKGIVYEFQVVHENGTQNAPKVGPTISIPQLALEETLPLFARKIAEREILAKEIAKKALARNLAKQAVENAINQQVAGSAFSQAAGSVEMVDQEQQARKEKFFQELANREQITNQIFDGLGKMTIKLPAKKQSRQLPKINKLNLADDFGKEEKPDTASTQEALRKQQEFGLQDVQQRQQKEDQENFQNRQKQEEVEKAQQRKQQAARQRKQKSEKDSTGSWLAGAGIGAGAAVGGAGFFTLFFS